MGPSGPSELMQALQDKEHELEALQRSHEEFVHSSTEIEHELELEVHRLEAGKRKLDEMLAQAMEDFRIAQATIVASNRDTLRLQSMVDELNKANVALTSQVQVLEQQNDDLERRERELQATVEDLEMRLDESIEQNVFLQQECDDLKKQSDIRPPMMLVPPPGPVPELPAKRRSATKVYITAKHSCGPTCSIM
ncbi:hypothetical protein THRCLA_03959 [Thraustotheca clavata]|uniref:Uncharacterized protein n=1 Tax=Thraustotheca clavata TaxID=74557 RepID=A0A1W0A0E8_9STRA|nr:hypothetical protein THRCLA_03959 [Thraustotheca clavata]